MRRGGWGRNRVGKNENRNKDSADTWDDKAQTTALETMRSLEGENDRADEGVGKAWMGKRKEDLKMGKKVKEGNMRGEERGGGGKYLGRMGG